jgi:gamma-butyrobetaine dioxygenase
MNGASMTSLPASAEAEGLPAAWLRDNCPCALCRDPVSGQRLLHITDIPADVAVAGTRVSADSVEVVFHPDGHRADNPYRDPAPTVQFLHCLRSAAAGGDSVFVDGFRAAAILRQQDPAAFAMLAVTPVIFGYRDVATELTATRALISLNPQGRIREIRFNSRSLQPVRLSRPQATAFYAAYRAFADLLCHPAAMLTARLAPGDCAVFDNTWILHARTGFASSGSRHLQGCYADLDGIESAVAVAGRGDQPERTRKDRK